MDEIKEVIITSLVSKRRVMKKKYIVLLIILLLSCGNYICDKYKTPDINYSEEILKNSYMLSSDYSIYDNYSAYILSNNNDNSYSLKYIDIENNLCSYLCSNANCLHDNKECASYIEAFNGCTYLLNTYKNIILFHRGNSINIPPSIEIMETNGQNRKKLTEFKMSQNINAPFIWSDNYLYFVLESTERENDKITTQYYLAKVSLNDGNYSFIYKNSNPIFLIGIKNNQLILKEIIDNTHFVHFITPSGDINERYFSYDRDDGQIFEYKEDLFFINYNNSSLEKITDFNKSELIMSVPFDGSATRTFIRHMTNNYIIVDNSTKTLNNDWTITKYFIDISNNNVISNESYLPNADKPISLPIYAITDNYLIFILGFNTSEELEFAKDGTSYYSQKRDPIFAKISIEDFLNNKSDYYIITNT